MASQYKKVKKYTGVYYSKSKVNKYRERPDRTYWINFRDLKSGKLRWERCGRASDGWTPEAAQRKRYEILEKDRAGKYKPKSLRKKESITFGQVMEDHYLTWVEQNKKRPSDDKSRYNTWIKDKLANKTLNRITKLDIESIMSEMKKAGRADATIRQVVSLIRHVFNKAIEWDLWEDQNPCKFIKLPKLNNARTRFLNKDEANKLLHELRTHSPQIAQIATMSLFTGMRLGEILALRWRDIDIEHKLITILNPKNNATRKVYITEPVEQVLKELDQCSPGEYLFKTKQGNSVNFLSKTFTNVVNKIGLNEGIDDRKQKVTFHTLRHTFASWSAMSGIPLFHLSKALGHKTTAMTERYSHLAPKSQKLAFEAVFNFTNK